MPNYLLLRRGQPCQSTGSSLSPPSPPSLPPSSPSTPSNTAHSRLNGSQKFAQQRSDAATRTNKGSFTLDELIKRQVGGKTCFFFSPRKTIGPVVCKESVGETFLIDKRGTFSCFQGPGLKTHSYGATWSRVFQNRKSVEALTFTDFSLLSALCHNRSLPLRSVADQTSPLATCVLVTQ